MRTKDAEAWALVYNRTTRFTVQRLGVHVIGTLDPYAPGSPAFMAARAAEEAAAAEARKRRNLLLLLSDSSATTMRASNPASAEQGDCHD